MCKIFKESIIDNQSRLDNKDPKIQREHRNIKTQGITSAETFIIKLDGFY